MCLGMYMIFFRSLPRGNIQNCIFISLQVDQYVYNNTHVKYQTYTRDRYSFFDYNNIIHNQIVPL